MEWQAVVLAVQILLLAAGWLLFQRARGELSARAAETPVLTEMQALQKNIKHLLNELEKTGDRQTARMEDGCAAVRTLLDELDEKLQDAEDRFAHYEQSLHRSTAAALEREAASACAAPEHTVLRLTTEESVIPAGDKCVIIEEVRKPATSNSIRADFTRSSETRSRREAIFSMADAGTSPAVIARMTQLSEGEVETLLGLRVQRS